MKKIILMTAAFLMLAAATAFGAQAGGQGAGVKIGYVDLQRALNECNAGKAAKADLQGMMKQLQSTIDQKVSETEKLKAELEKQALVLSPEARKQKQDAIEKLTKETQALISNSNSEMQKKQRLKEIAILKKIKAVIDDIGTKGDYLVILPADVILYSRNGIEVTDEVISRVNQMGSKSAPRAPAKSGK
ncbi:MAG: OmpH family outer membrane protein [Nitrospiraceae bacterium]|nr:OmpH family outer membrane protein [Nitrospiraceae bacterium]MDA8326074.1 OmpH family outer membrane protein [Nitrospiraceae bacterium]